MCASFVFRTIVNLLQCDVMMAIISKVLHKAFLGEMKFFQESHLQKVSVGHYRTSPSPIERRAL